MKSLRVWLTSIALGAAMMFSAPTVKAQVPTGFTYQGVIEENGTPYTGNANLTITLGPQNGTILWTETLANIPVFEGVFNVVIGGSTPLPSTMNFNEQYFMTVVVTDANGTVTLPPTALWAAPYAINAAAVNGMLASSVPVAGQLFPVPTGTGYTGSAKMDPAFLPNGIPDDLLAVAPVETINDVNPDANGKFTITGALGITITPFTNGITISGTNTIPSDVIGSSSSSAASLTVLDSEVNGNEALLVKGGVGANNATGTSDGSGINSISPQTYWADRVFVPPATGTSLQIFNTLIVNGSTIVLTPVETAASANQLAITAQAAGTFTVSAAGIMGTSGGGTVMALNYMVINH